MRSPAASLLAALPLSPLAPRSRSEWRTVLPAAGLGLLSPDSTTACIRLRRPWRDRMCARFLYTSLVRLCIEPLGPENNLSASLFRQERGRDRELRYYDAWMQA